MALVRSDIETTDNFEIGAEYLLFTEWEKWQES